MPARVFGARFRTASVLNGDVALVTQKDPSLNMFNGQGFALLLVLVVGVCAAPPTLHDRQHNPRRSHRHCGRRMERCTLQSLVLDPLWSLHSGPWEISLIPASGAHSLPPPDLTTVHPAATSDPTTLPHPAESPTAVLQCNANRGTNRHSTACDDTALIPADEVLQLDHGTLQVGAASWAPSVQPATTWGAACPQNFDTRGMNLTMDEDCVSDALGSCTRCGAHWRL